RILENGKAFSLPLSDEEISSSDENKDLKELESDENITDKSEK
ncbi:15731_t:CDS:1, partial [Racocetra fulgida]